ncbi:RNA-directed DNA polymerase, eukaryota [Tanacetum coccineum]|uniref:RNA-directed DNA polymerase, eukaryota n=1 Tax=Tanacetum coccineum TaxID=301880 RepID=A0ABQ5BXM9_9ASTR
METLEMIWSPQYVETGGSGSSQNSIVFYIPLDIMKFAILDTLRGKAWRKLLENKDRWVCDLNGNGDFRVKEIRKALDDIFLPFAAEATRWVKVVPIKLNVFAWRARIDRLPSRNNLASRGVVLDSDVCPLCGVVPEDIEHVLFRCDTALSLHRRVCSWWDLEQQDVLSFSDWNNWFASIRLSAKIKSILEGVFVVTWWHIWLFRNRSIFGSSPPRRSVLFNDIIMRSFTWISSRCNSSFTWESWLKNPSLFSL